MIVKMMKNLENRMEKMEESINKDLGELKNKHKETKNIITEIKKKLITEYLKQNNKSVSWNVKWWE